MTSSLRTRRATPHRGTSSSTLGASLRYISYHKKLTIAAERGSTSADGVLARVWRCGLFEQGRTARWEPLPYYNRGEREPGGAGEARALERRARHLVRGGRGEVRLAFGFMSMRCGLSHTLTITRTQQCIKRWPFEAIAEHGGSATPVIDLACWHAMSCKWHRFGSYPAPLVFLGLPGRKAVEAWRAPSSGRCQDEVGLPPGGACMQHPYFLALTTSASCVMGGFIRFIEAR